MRIRVFGIFGHPLPSDLSRSDILIRTSRLAASLALSLVVLAWAPVRSAAQDLGFGDRSRLRAATPVGVQAWVDWDELITETAGGATEAQFHQAILQAFERALGAEGVVVDPDADRFLLCRVETLYDSGLIAFAARVELHEPFDGGSTTAITWHRTWIGTTPVRGMHLLFTIGERCAEDFLEARDSG